MDLSLGKCRISFESELANLGAIFLEEKSLSPLPFTPVLGRLVTNTRGLSTS